MRLNVGSGRFVCRLMMGALRGRFDVNHVQPSIQNHAQVHYKASKKILNASGTCMAGTKHISVVPSLPLKRLSALLNAEAMYEGSIVRLATVRVEEIRRRQAL